MNRSITDRKTNVVLRKIARDEGRFCTMLASHITRLGGVASSRTGQFSDKLAAVTEVAQRLELLNRGQGWVVRKLQEALPRINDVTLHRDLKEMMEVHERNIGRCNSLN